MAVGWLVSLVMVLSGTVGAGRGAFEAFWVAAAIAVVLAIYSLTLPHTPRSSSRTPSRRGSPTRFASRGAQGWVCSSSRRFAFT